MTSARETFMAPDGGPTGEGAGPSPEHGSETPANPLNDGVWPVVLGAGTFTVLAGVILATASLTDPRVLVALVVILGPTLGFALPRIAGHQAGATAAGVWVWLGLTSLASAAVLRLTHAALHNVTAALVGTALTCLIAFVAWSWRAAPSGERRQFASRVIKQTFARPTSGILATIIGAGVALPIIGLQTDVIRDEPSARLALLIQGSPADSITSGSTPVLGSLVADTLISLAHGYRASIAFSVLTAVALTMVVAFLAHQVTGSAVGALTASLIIVAMPATTQHVTGLSLYSAAISLAYLAVWLLHRTMSDSRPLPARVAVAAGVLMGLSLQANEIGQIFVAVPLLLLALHPWIRARRPLLLYAATIAVLGILQALVNPEVFTDFWGADPTELWTVVRDLPGAADQALGGRGVVLLLVAVAAFAARTTERRSLIFVAAASGLTVILLAFGPALPDRLMPAVPALAIAVAAGVVAMRNGDAQVKMGGTILLIVLAVGAFLNLEDVISGNVMTREMARGGPWVTFTEHVDDDRAVVGVNAYTMAWTNPNARVADETTLSDSEWATFLDWPADEAIDDVFLNNDIGWIYVPPNATPRTNHMVQALRSDSVCLVAEDRGFLLYRYGECLPGDLRTLPDEFIVEHYDPFSMEFAPTP